MPDRILRDELLTSERYWSVSIEAQRLFVHLVLCVDDTARFSGKNYTIRAACYPGQSVDPGKLEKLLLELVDTDLVRLYTVGMDRFIFLPRSKQRLRYARSRYPAPPNEINDILLEKSDLRQTQDGLKSAEVKRSEEKRSKTLAPDGASEHRKPRREVDQRFLEFWSAYPRKKSKGQAEKAWMSLKPDDDLSRKVLQGLAAAKRSQDWLKDNGRYIPHPATWLRARGWEDEHDVEGMRRVAI